MGSKRELNVFMPSGFPAEVRPLTQSVADSESSEYKAALHEAMQVKLDDRHLRIRGTVARAETCRC